MSSLNLAFVGLGKMGKSIQRLAHERGHKTVSEIESGQEISSDSLGESDLVIECTVPQVCVENIGKICQAGKNCIVVTTGWYEDLEKVKKMVENSGIRFLYASNFSIGVHLYFKIVEQGAKLINHIDDYDIWGHEIHHHNKVDSPSGTAKTLEEILIKNIVRKTDIVEEKLDRKIEPHEIHFSSTRGGAVNFMHTIGFDSSADTITISHNARNRDGYGLGAVKVGEWLITQKPGFYTMGDYLGDQLVGGK